MKNLTTKKFLALALSAAMSLSLLTSCGDGQSFVCVQSNKDQFPDIDSVNDPKFQIGAQPGSIQLQLAQLYAPDAEIIQLGKVTDVVVVKDNPALLAAVNLAINEAVDSGKMEEFRAEAKALADGETYEGLLDADGKIQG